MTESQPSISKRPFCFKHIRGRQRSSLRAPGELYRARISREESHAPESAPPLSQSPAFRPNVFPLHDVRYSEVGNQKTEIRKPKPSVSIRRSRLPKRSAPSRDPRGNPRQHSTKLIFASDSKIEPRPLAFRLLISVFWFRTSVAGPATGGARRDRTDDLMLAKHALSQLSYGPGQ